MLDVVTAGKHEGRKCQLSPPDIRTRLQDVCNTPLAKELSPRFVTFFERFNERLAFWKEALHESAVCLEEAGSIEQACNSSDCPRSASGFAYVRACDVPEEDAC